MDNSTSRSGMVDVTPGLSGQAFSHPETGSAQQCLFCSVDSSFATIKRQGRTAQAADTTFVTCPACDNLHQIDIAIVHGLYNLGYVPELSQAQIIQVFLAKQITEAACAAAIQAGDLSAERTQEIRRMETAVTACWGLIEDRRNLIHYYLSQPFGMEMLKSCGFDATSSSVAQIDKHFTAEMMSNLLLRLKSENPDLYQQRHELLGGLRFIPNQSQWQKHGEIEAAAHLHAMRNATKPLTNGWFSYFSDKTQIGDEDKAAIMKTITTAIDKTTGTINQLKKTLADRQKNQA